METPTTDAWSTEHGFGPSTVLAGRYRIRRLLGEGGMGRVFLATDLREKRDVAVKVLTDERPIPKAEERFTREARATRKINHPNVVSIFDVGHSPRGGLFFVMEYLEGEELAITMERELRLPWPRVQHIAVQICEALGAAHAQGVVHRDLKLENCYRVNRKGDPDFIKILDFGVAKLIGGDPDAEGRLTNTGAAIGTPVYMAPELCRGRGVDHRVDIYALGVIIYELLCGTVPFEGDAFLDVALQHMNDPPPPMSTHVDADEVPPQLEAVVMRALAKSREDRYPTMEAMAAALREISGGAARSTGAYDGMLSTASRTNPPSGRVRALGRTEVASAVPEPSEFDSHVDSQTVSAPMPLASVNRQTMPSAMLPSSGRSQAVDTSTEWVAARPRRRPWVIGAVLFGVIALVGVVALGWTEITGGSASEEPVAAVGPSSEPGVPEDNKRAKLESSGADVAAEAAAGSGGAADGATPESTAPGDDSSATTSTSGSTKKRANGSKKSRGLSKSQIDKTLSAKVKRALHICGGAATGGQPGDKIKMSISIDLPTGKVKSAKVLSHSTTAKARGCVRDLVLRASFPAQSSKGTKTVTRTFKL